MNNNDDDDSNSNTSNSSHHNTNSKVSDIWTPAVARLLAGLPDGLPRPAGLPACRPAGLPVLYNIAYYTIT